MKQKKGIIVIAYLNICILWGSSNMATKIGVTSINPLQFACLRFLIAGIILTVIAVLKNDWRLPSKSDLKILLTIGLLMNFLTNGCVVISNTLIDSGIVTLMLATIPIFTTVIEVFVKKSLRINRNIMIGLFGGFAGIGIVVFYGDSGFRINMTGILIILAGSLFWAIGSIYSKDKIVNGTIFKHTAVEALSAALLFFITSNLLGQFHIEDITMRNLYPILYLAVFDSVIGFVSYIYLLKVLPSTKVCTYAYINPVVALILGFLFLGERLTWGKIVGMIVIILSVMLIQSNHIANQKIKEGLRV